MAIAEEAIEEVAQNLEEVADATRRINASGVGYFIFGTLAGAALGFYLGNRYSKKKARDEAFAEAEKEIDEMREFYQQKIMVLDDKPKAEDIIRERGYDRPLPAPVPVRDPKMTVDPLAVEPEWDYAVELQNRSREAPYVIHQDEFREENNHRKVAYTYWAGDDVLCDEDQRPLPHADLIVGQENLKFGHGADDADVVFVRNEEIEVDMEICRSSGSYEEEVLGLDGHEPS